MHPDLFYFSQYRPEAMNKHFVPKLQTLANQASRDLKIKPGSQSLIKRSSRLTSKNITTKIIVMVALAGVSQ